MDQLCQSFSLMTPNSFSVFWHGQEKLICSHNLECAKCALISALHRKGVASSPADVTVTGGDSSLSVQTPGGELSFALPAGIALEQGSCIPTPAGDSCREELHFRLRISIAENSKEGDVPNSWKVILCFAGPLCAKARLKSFGSYL